TRLPSAPYTLERYEKEKEEAKSKMKTFCELAAHFSDRELVLALYVFYAGRGGIDWIILDLQKTYRAELIRRLCEKSHVFAAAANVLPKRLEFLRILINRAADFYPTPEQLAADYPRPPL